MHVRTAAALLSCALILPACGSRLPPPAEAEPIVQASAPPSPSQRPSRRPSASPRPVAPPSPSPVPTPPAAPLTGQAPVEPALLARPVAAVKIDNADPARPQQGLELADVVFEELVEGGYTRFLALYQSGDPGVVGPVRSARDVDALLLPPFTPVMGISGAADPTYEVLEAAGLRYLEEKPEGRPSAAPGAFVRDPARQKIHDLMVSVAHLWATPPAQPAPVAAWPFDVAVPAGGAPAGGVRLLFAEHARSTWTWVPANGAWLREQEGAPHLVASGGQIAADNVVVMRVGIGDGGGVDAGGSHTVAVGVLGEGEGLLLRDGQALPLRWRKNEPTAQLQWLAPDGSPLPLKPGRTWVELLPATTAPELLPPV